MNSLSTSGPRSALPGGTYFGARYGLTSDGAGAALGIWPYAVFPTGAANVPALGLVADGKLKPVAELKTMFEAAGIDVKKPVITTCGSGVTASTLMLALKLAGAEDVAVYDGAWAEYGARDDAVVVRD